MCLSRLRREKKRPRVAQSVIMHPFIKFSVPARRGGDYCVEREAPSATADHAKTLYGWICHRFGSWLRINESGVQHLNWLGLWASLATVLALAGPFPANADWNCEAEHKGAAFASSCTDAAVWTFVMSYGATLSPPAKQSWSPLLCLGSISLCSSASDGLSSEFYVFSWTKYEDMPLCCALQLHFLSQFPPI